MKRLLILLCLPALVQTKKALAQDTASRFSLTVSPALFTPVSVAVQGGIQYRFSKRLSLLTEFAYPTFYPDNEYEKITYWRSSIEVKLHTTNTKTKGRYYSIQGSYLYRTLLEENGSTVHQRDGEYRFDAATIQSPVVALALKAGMELRTNKGRAFADVFLGAGARRIFNNYTAQNLRLTSIDQTNDKLAWLIPDEGWRFGYQLTRFHFTAGVRFGLGL